MRQPKLQHGYEVETCVELPIVDGDTDYDNATYRCYDKATKDEAVALAKQLLPNDKFGSIAITEFTMAYDGKDYVSETEYVEP